MYNRDLFSERLNKARKEKSLTQRELAEKAGVTAATISAYEKGVKSPVLETVIKLADALTVSIDWLCGAEKSTKDIETYADIIIKLVDALRPIRYDICSYTESYTNIRKCEISILDYILKPFVEDLGKMKTLLDGKTIDENIFDSWVDGQVKKYIDIKIPKRDGAFPPDDDEELPF